MFSRKQAKNRGSLLIEVLLSVVILSTALTLMIQSMTASLRGIRDSAGYTTALVMLEGRMAEILQQGTIAAGVRETKDLTESAPVYRYSLTTKSSDIVPEDKINQVDASILWSTGKRENTLGLTTFLPAPVDE